MSTFLRIQTKGQLTPSRLRSQIGLADGDMVEAIADGGRIVLTPNAAIARSQLPNADNEYSPGQRRVIDRRLAEGLRDIKKGRLHGPFQTHEDMIAFLNKNGRASRGSSKARSNEK